MVDREKVIKGLECCHVQRNEVPPLCEDCPYMNPMEGTCDSLDELLGDALTLLKAQEPRVMTLEEVKSSVGNDMYLEISTRTDEMPYITAATLDGAGQKGVVFTAIILTLWRTIGGSMAGVAGHPARPMSRERQHRGSKAEAKAIHAQLVVARSGWMLVL